MQDDFQISQDTPLLPPSKDNSVCLVLRHHGELLGYGSSESLTEATQTVFNTVKKHRIFSMPLSNTLKTKMIDSISIELEIGFTVIPSPQKNSNRFAHGFITGGDSIAVRRGEHWRRRMQSELRLSPYRPVSNIVESLCIDLGVHPTITLSHELPLQEDVTFYAIPTTTYIQDSADTEPRKLYRGDELVQQPTIHESHLLLLADSLAEHLLLSISENGATIGGYQPETNTFTSMFATHFVQALTAYALQDYALTSGVTHHEEAIESSNRVIKSIALDVERTTTIDLESASLLVMLFLEEEFTLDESITELYSLCTDKIIDAGMTFNAKSPDSLKPFVLSLVGNALVSLGVDTANSKIAQLGNTIISFCLFELSPGAMVSTIPWSIDGAFLLQEAEINNLNQPLDDLLQGTLSSQIVTGDVDLLGGFSLSTNHGNVVDARGLRMLPMLALFCKHSPSSKSSAFQSLVLATRFLEQLTTSTNRSQRFEHSAMSKGGVRKAPWDASMPTEATAMALTGISNFVKIIQELQSKVE